MLLLGEAVEMAYCTSCGAPQNGADKFCGRCGTPFSSANAESKSTTDRLPNTKSDSDTSKPSAVPFWSIVAIGLLLVTGAFVGIAASNFNDFKRAHQSVSEAWSHPDNLGYVTGQVGICLAIVVAYASLAWLLWRMRLKRQG